MDGDLLTLLTVDQMERIFPEKKDRVCAITDFAVKHGVNVDRLSHYEIWFDKNRCYSWWWLREMTSAAAITAPIVEVDGTLRIAEKAVNKPSGAIRSVVWVKTESS